MRIVALFIVLALAGCLSSDAGEPEPPAQPPAPLVHWLLSQGELALDPAQWNGTAPEVRWLPVSVDGSPQNTEDGREPTVAVDSQGILYYAARDYSGGNTPPASATQTPIMRSMDGGLTWQDVSPRLPTGDREPPRSGDPMVVADPWTDRIFQIELYDLVCNWIVFTDDQGDSWTSNAKGCGSLVVDHQTITAGPPRITPLPQEGIYPNMVYVCVNQIADSHCARSLDGGLTLETFHIVYPGVHPETGALCGGIHGHALVEPGGRVYLPREYCGRPYVAISEDDGLTWELLDLGGPQGASSGDPNMAFDGAGTVYYSYMGYDEAGHQGVFLVAMEPDGSSATPPVRISHPDFTYANHVSMTAGTDGRLGFVYLATMNTPDGNDWSNVTWDAYMAYSDDGDAGFNGAAPTVLHVQANPDGDPVYRGDCRNIRCGFIREFLDASVAPDGSFYGAFIDACLHPDEPRARSNDDCNTLRADYGQGNGHLAYVGHFSGPSLFDGDRVISGSG